MRPAGPGTAAGAISLEDLQQGDLGACCAELYRNPAVRWLLGDQLHPGGERLTARALDLLGLEPEQRLLDVASGAGTATLMAVSERGCEGVGVELGAATVAEATEVARELGLQGRARFVEADARRLPFGTAQFDAALCECSLCLFEDKPAALAEVHRVLRPGGRIALSDVVVVRERLPQELLGPLATLACVGEALSRRGLEQAMVEAGFEIEMVEDHSADATAMASQIRDRLRGARILGFEHLLPVEGGMTEALRLLDLARDAIADRAIGYLLLSARRT